jgi:hypothetical protein
VEPKSKVFCASFILEDNQELTPNESKKVGIYAIELTRALEISGIKRSIEIPKNSCNITNLRNALVL